MLDTDRPSRAIRRLLHVDRTFADEPRRLRRGLTDLLPDEDEAVRLLAAGAEAGVPALLKFGAAAQARQALVDGAGLRPGDADWVVAVWTAGLDASEPPRAAPGAGDGPGAPEAVSMALLADGTALLLTRGTGGVHAGRVGLGDPRPAPPRWQRVAAPAEPGSRDAAVAVTGGGATIVWSDRAGVFAAEVRPDGIGRARLIVPAGPGEQARRPLGALAVEDGSLDVFWSADGRRLRRGMWRSWSAEAVTLDLPPACGAGEELRRVAVGRGGADVAWLAVATDQGRLLISRWDLGRDTVAAWVPVPLPMRVLDVAAVGGSMLVATDSGQPLMFDSASAFARQAVAPPPASGRSGDRVESLAAAFDPAGVLWIAMRVGGIGALTNIVPDSQRRVSLSLWPA
ncbi:hypothetical protein [Dactylosporangium sp. NPDC049140]|uniref:hypothetical protein n=1 Tax=Dactylosporangium sp. NPDC049140 TaxID=3155647 RepID=UPI0033C6B760